MPVRSLRRHLVLLSAPHATPPDAPVVWRLGQEVYFRPESGGLLASPCDEEPWPAEDPPSDPRALEALALRLGRTAPALASAQVRRSWACLRSFVPDRGFVAGPDPRVEGLHWMTALGGHGMTCGVALAEIVADLVMGRPHERAVSLSPARWVDPKAPTG